MAQTEVYLCPQANVALLKAELEATLNRPVDGVTSGPRGVVMFITPGLAASETALVETVVAAHSPAGKTLTELAQEVALANAQDVLDRWLASSLHGKSPAQLYTALQSAMDGWTSLADAKADLRQWLPLMAAVLAWKTLQD